MDVILNDLLGEDQTISLNKTEKEECYKILEKSLQCKTRNYNEYFSSRPCSGSIVEDIAEIDAQISILERKLKNQLTENKDVVLNSLLNDSSNENVTNIRKELDQLWEIDNKTPKKAANVGGDSSVDDFLELDTGSQEKQEDQFHGAIKKLKERSSKEGDNHNFSSNLAVILENLNNITDLMELPFLARTCIKTGHYQEALMIYTYSKSLLANFPNSSIVHGIYSNVSKETTTTMLTGLINLLSTNVTVISLKKILNYLVSIPPFDNRDKTILLKVYLQMRFKFIKTQLDYFPIKPNSTNDSLIEMMVKRKIEILREHIYTTITVFADNVQIETQSMQISLKEPISQESEDKALPTNPFIIEFISKCISCFFADLQQADLQGKLNESVCLQLVYCSFRLQDINNNYHTLFLNKIYESHIFSEETLKNAISKRRELQAKYSQ